MSNAGNHDTDRPAPGLLEGGPAEADTADRCETCDDRQTEVRLRRRAPDDSTLDVCGRCADELTTDFDYRWGGFLHGAAADPIPKVEPQ